MATNFPTSVDSFTTKANNVDTISAANVNDLQDSVVAIETLLGAGALRSTSWSPTFTFETTPPTSISYGANNAGRYCQFGNIVFFTCRLVVSSFVLGSGAGNIRCILPSTSANVAGNWSTVAVRAVSGFATLWPAVGQIPVNTNVCQLLSYTSTAAPTLLTASNVSTSGFEVLFSGFYIHA